MRKQFRYEQLVFGKFGLYIFHDGKMVANQEIWSPEIFDIIEELEEDGYTYGFLPNEAEEALKRYERIKNNIIEGKL